MVTEPGWDPFKRNCPTRALLDRIGDRWTVLVVGSLADGSLRFGEIARRVDGISQKMLTRTLRSLEHDGLVLRTQHLVIPPRVDYELTDLGHSLLEPLRALANWAITNMSDVLQHQDDEPTD